MRWTIFTALFCLIASGCSSSARNSQQDLAANGHITWYPADASIAPGQIWVYDGALRAKFAERPEGLTFSSPEPVSLASNIELATALSSEFNAGSLSQAGPFSAELYAGTAREGSIHYADASSVSLHVEDLQGNVAAKFGTGYAQALQMVRWNRPGLVLITSVVRVSEVEYKLWCDDPHQVGLRLPRLRALVDAKIEFKVTSPQYAMLKLTPPTGKQALIAGVLPVHGDGVAASVESSRKKLAEDLQFARKQSYAFMNGLPGAAMTSSKTMVAADDSVDAVERKYLILTGKAEMAAATSPQTRPSGTVVEPLPDAPVGGTPQPRPEPRPATQPAVPAVPPIREPAPKPEVKPELIPEPKPATPDPKPTTPEPTPVPAKPELPVPADPKPELPAPAEPKPAPADPKPEVPTSPKPEPEVKPTTPDLKPETPSPAEPKPADPKPALEKPTDPTPTPADNK